VESDARLAQKCFDDYILEARSPPSILSRKRPAERRRTSIVYCLGGTLRVATLGFLSQNGKGDRVANANFFVKPAGFSRKPGELGVFHYRRGGEASSVKYNERGYLEGS